MLYLHPMRYIFFVLIFCSLTLQAQIHRDPNSVRTIEDINKSENDSILSASNQAKPSDSLKIYNPSISDYKVRFANTNLQAVDTALTLDAYYKKNVYQKDLFLYQEPSNLGLSLNPLAVETHKERFQILPTGKSYMYKPVDSIQYYNVKTPLTQFIFENGMQEGQFLSTTFSHNIHARWNYTLNYDYLNSMGRYLNTNVKNTSFMVNTNYITANNRYQVQAAFVSHDLNNYENGGLTQKSLEAYIDNDPNFTNRQNMFSNLQGTFTKFDERRIQLQHKFGILSFGNKTDSLAKAKEFPIYIQHQWVYKHQDFEYNETPNNPQNYFDTIPIGTQLHNRKKLDNLTNKITLGYQWSQRLNVQGGLVHQFIKPYYDEPQVYSKGIVPAEKVENRLGITANLLFQWKEHIKLTAEGEITEGNTFGNAYDLNAAISIAPAQGFLFKGGLRLNAGFPHLNYFYSQSFYDKFNYYNEKLENETSQEIYAGLSSHSLGLHIYGKLFNINHYTYWDHQWKIQQATDPLKYFAIGAQEHYKVGNFGAEVRVQYQNVIANESLYPVPEIIARATLYYENQVFNNNMHLMAGISTHYFSQFNSREFFPLMNEFSLQDPNQTRSIGNYPQIDLFLNMKIRRMRIYLRTENINSFFMPGQNFYTPQQPSRDFKIQLGIHWFLFS